MRSPLRFARELIATPASQIVPEVGRRGCPCHARQADGHCDHDRRHRAHLDSEPPPSKGAGSEASDPGQTKDQGHGQGT